MCRPSAASDIPPKPLIIVQPVKLLTVNGVINYYTVLLYSQKLSLSPSLCVSPNVSLPPSLPLSSPGPLGVVSVAPRQALHRVIPAAVGFTGLTSQLTV